MAIYRALVRHGLIEPGVKRKRLPTYKRWERGRAMELWQMDVVGGVLFEDGSEAKILTGVDDHSQFYIAGGETRTTQQTESPAASLIHFLAKAAATVSTLNSCVVSR